MLYAQTLFSDHKKIRETTLKQYCFFFFQFFPAHIQVSKQYVKIGNSYVNFLIFI
jgi:hypothetical protein